MYSRVVCCLESHGSTEFEEICLYACLTSDFASSAPLPRKRMAEAVSATETQEKGQSSWLIPTLMLWLWGLERSTMRRHLLGWWRLGITPKLLTWTVAAMGLVAIRPCVSSDSKYGETTSGWLYAEPMFQEHDRSEWLNLRSNPIQNPWEILSTMIWANSLSGCWQSAHSHSLQQRGVTISDKHRGIQVAELGVQQARPRSW